MNRKFLLLIILTCLAFCIFFPTEFTAGASYGLRLWCQALLPVLLPFFILTGLLRGMGYTRLLDTRLAPFTCRILRLPPSYGSVFLFGLVSGLPVSAMLINQLPDKDKRDHLIYALLLTSHMSPGFITGYLAANILQKPAVSVFLFLLIYGMNMMTAILFLRPEKSSRTSCFTDDCYAIPHSLCGCEGVSSRSFSMLFGETVINGIRSIFCVGVSVMFFSIMTGFFSMVLPHVGHYLGIPVSLCSLITILLSGLCEVTGGCSLLLIGSVPRSLRLMLVVLFTSFGGLSGIFQTKSMLTEPLAVGKYIRIKISTALLSALAMLTLNAFFHFY